MRKPRHARGLVAIAAALGIALTGSLAACSSGGSGGGSTTGGKTEINALFMKQAGYSEDQINEMISSFEADHPDIKVKPTFVAYEALHDKIVTSAPAGTYDVVLIDVIWPAEFASKGIVMDLTDKYPATWKDEMLGGAYTTAEFQNKFWGVPWGPSTKFFYYNKEMMSKVGATEADIQTWDGVLKVAKKIKDAGLSQYPIAWSWAQAEAVICDYAQLLGAFGGKFTDDSGKLVINQGPGVEALKWMKKSIDDGLTNPGSTTFLEDDVAKTMEQGQTAFSLNWESTLGELNDPSISNVVDKTGIMATPAGPSGARPGVNGAMALSIPAKSKKADAAWSFIEYVTSKDVQDKYPTGWPPNWKASYSDTEVTKASPELFKAAETAYSDLILRPTVENYNSVSQILQTEIQNALLGNKDPQKALDDAVSQANALITK